MPTQCNKCIRNATSAYAMQHVTQIVKSDLHTKTSNFNMLGTSKLLAKMAKLTSVYESFLTNKPTIHLTASFKMSSNFCINGMSYSPLQANAIKIVCTTTFDTLTQNEPSMYLNAPNMPKLHAIQSHINKKVMQKLTNCLTPDFLTFKSSQTSLVTRILAIMKTISDST